jgi:hypothetical protein
VERLNKLASIGHIAFGAEKTFRTKLERVLKESFIVVKA